MEVKAFSNNFAQEKLILSGDIGGTNSNLALIGYNGGKFEILIETIFKTSEIKDFTVPFKESFEYLTMSAGGRKPDLCCICAAGPMENNICTLTNAGWQIDANQLQTIAHMKVLLINDFAGLSYGIPLLDISDPTKVTKLPNALGQYPEPTGNSRAIIGAGTGLGVGFITYQYGKYIAVPSEGGHFDFPAFDEETMELAKYLTKKFGFYPGTERLVSGQGLSNIFDYYAEHKKVTMDETLLSIKNAETGKRPALIAKAAMENHPVCCEIHKLFRKIYGKMAGNYCTVFLPTAGIYIAGGIISKDEKLFLSDDTFIKYFAINHNYKIMEIQNNIPIYFVRDYATSLLGAANAAIQLR